MCEATEPDAKPGHEIGMFLLPVVLPKGITHERQPGDYWHLARFKFRRSTNHTSYGSYIALLVDFHCLGMQSWVVYWTLLVCTLNIS